jgi:chaperonin cofactor prefoldin
VYLENENKNTPDAKLEKEIEFLKNRIDKLESQNHDVERDLEKDNGKAL